MAQKVDELDALVARKVFGWKRVHRNEEGFYGKKQDRLGRWRSTKVPNYSTDPLDSHQIEARMKQLEMYQRYTKELAKLTQAKGLPAEWATPEQSCRAALKTVAPRKSLRLVKK